MTGGILITLFILLTDVEVKAILRLRYAEMKIKKSVSTTLLASKKQIINSQPLHSFENFMYDVVNE